MNNRMIEDFVYRYGAKVDHQSRRNRIYNGSDRAIDYDNEGRVDIELSYRAFEHLVKMDNQAEEDYNASREEARVRRQYPAVADAYHKYKMLLELCK